MQSIQSNTDSVTHPCVTDCSCKHWCCARPCIPVVMCFSCTASTLHHPCIWVIDRNRHDSWTQGARMPCNEHHLLRALVLISAIVVITAQPQQTPSGSARPAVQQSQGSAVALLLQDVYKFWLTHGQDKQFGELRRSHCLASQTALSAGDHAFSCTFFAELGACCTCSMPAFLIVHLVLCTLLTCLKTICHHIRFSVI